MKFLLILTIAFAALKAGCAYPTLAGGNTFTGINTFSSNGNSFQGSFSDGSAADTMTAANGFVSGNNGKGFSDYSGYGFTSNNGGGFVDYSGGFTENGNNGFIANGNNGFTDNSQNGSLIEGGGNLTISSSGSVIISGSGDFQGNAGGVTGVPATGIIHQLIQTNFVSGKVYVNGYGAIIQVSANAVLVTTGVAGAADLELRIPGTVTNKVATSTLVTSLASSVTNSIIGFVPSGSSYMFTNNSSGTGDSATVVAGQIFY